MSDNHSLRIGISDCAKYENYRRWITETGNRAVLLNPQTIGGVSLEELDGLLLSGGEDVQPGLYHKPEYVSEYKLTDINPARDAFEYGLIRSWLAMNKPLLGICRGLQVMNVALGGTLIPDIPAVFGAKDHSKIQGIDQRHAVEVISGSLLGEIAGKAKGNVNSAHHQSVADPADALRVVALADQNVVEAMEWKEAEGKSWFLLVQWHPERMTDPENPFSAKLREHFLTACAKKNI